MQRWIDAIRNAIGWASSTGSAGERAAARHLKQNRYRILVQNLANAFGEIDLVAQAPDGRTVVIVEVKTRQLEHAEHAGKGILPEVRVAPAKQRKLVALAGQLLRRYDLKDRPVRFDVIGVDLPPAGTRAKPMIRHHEAAFESHV